MIRIDTRYFLLLTSYFLLFTSYFLLLIDYPTIGVIL